MSQSPWDGSKDLSCFLSLLLLRAESKLPRIQQTQYVPRNFTLGSSSNNTLRIIYFSSQEQPKYILRKSTLISQEIGPVNGVEAAWEKGHGVTKKYRFPCKSHQHASPEDSVGVQVSLVPIGRHYATRGTSLLGPVSTTWYQRVDQMKSPSKLLINPIKWAEQEPKPLLPVYVRA